MRANLGIFFPDSRLFPTHTGSRQYILTCSTYKRLGRFNTTIFRVGEQTFSFQKTSYINFRFKHTHRTIFEKSAKRGFLLVFNAKISQLIFKLLGSLGTTANVNNCLPIIIRRYFLMLKAAFGGQVRST